MVGTEDGIDKIGIKHVAIVIDKMQILAIALIQFDDTDGLFTQNGAAAGFDFATSAERQKS